MSLLKALNDPQQPQINVEWCPPQMDLSLEQSLDAWIDSNHFIRKVTSLHRFVFMTDGSTGRREEQNLRHVIINLGTEVDYSLIVPILTAKHPLDYCLNFAEKAYELGFRSLVVLGGDRFDGVPRCVEHGYELRKMIRERVPGLTLGGWANPHAGIEQVEFMVDADYCADFYLSQITSHHNADALDEFLDACADRGVQIPGVFGAFYYRSANPRTLNAVGKFFPVPIEELKADFAGGRGPEDICAETIHALLRCGMRNIYLSNLPTTDVEGRMARIEARLEDIQVSS